MKARTIFLCLLMASGTLLSQGLDAVGPTRPLNSMSLNFLGDASLISVAYERQYILKENFLLTTKLGLGYNSEVSFCLFGSCSRSEYKYVTFPHHITGNWGKGKHFLEFGLGGTYVAGNTNYPYVVYPLLGYRILPLEKDKLNFRIYHSYPFSGNDILDYYFAIIGLSVGVSF